MHSANYEEICSTCTIINLQAHESIFSYYILDSKLDMFCNNKKDTPSTRIHEYIVCSYVCMYVYYK